MSLRSTRVYHRNDQGIPKHVSGEHHQILADCDPPGANDTASLLRSIGSRNNVIDSHLVCEVFLHNLDTMEQKLGRILRNAQPPVECHVFVDAHTSRWFFLCKLPLLLRAAARKSRRRGSFDMSSLVAPGQATVVPSEPQARKLSRDSVPTVHINKKRPLPTTNFPTPLAHEVTNMKSLCLRLRIGVVTRALHAQSDCRVRGTARPFTHHLIRHCSCRRKQCRIE